MSDRSDQPTRPRPPPGWEEFEPGYYRPIASSRAKILDRYKDEAGLKRLLEALRNRVRMGNVK